jgi:hypothetical protein
MRPALVILAVAVVTAAVGGAAPAQPASARPEVRLGGKAVLVVKGIHFARRELVRVVVVAPAGRVARRLRTTRSGTFTTSFPAIRVDPCGTPPEVTVVGARSGTVRTISAVRDCATP